MIEHGHLNMGFYSNDIDVEMWLPEMNMNTTIFCDRLMDKNKDGFLAIHTDLNCISTLNIEYQSSGFTVQEADIEKGILLLKADPSKIKDELFVPKDVFSGFMFSGNYRKPGKSNNLDDQLLDIDAHYNRVPTKPFGHKYILNFSVSGEFHLEIYYLRNAVEEPSLIFSKSYCCK